MERTLVVFKPDSVMRGIVGQVLARFERAGLKIIGIRMLQPDYEKLYNHYEAIGTLKTRKGDEIFESQLKTMMLGPVIALVLEGIEAVDFVRKMVGPTEPKSAAPGTIRGDYAHINYASGAKAGMGVPNIVHASATKEEAEKEIALWFDVDHLCQYDAAHGRFTQPKPTLDNK